MENRKIDILGTTYTIEFKTVQDDDFLEKCDGYYDKTSKKIVVGKENNDCELDLFEEYQKKVLRHEIIHAFMYESGLAENWEHKSIGQEETAVDWFAIQLPKITKVCQELGCI